MLSALRRVDALGRVGIPSEIRKTLNIDIGDTAFIEIQNGILTVICIKDKLDKGYKPIKDSNIRRINTLGKVSIPVCVRRTLGIMPWDTLKVRVESSKILFTQRKVCRGSFI